jgi:hypothetical protein
MTRTHKGYDAPTIEFYCVEPHPENRYSAARFVRKTEGWALLPQWLHAEVDNASPRTRRQREDIAVRIDGRIRYNLYCDVCGFTVPVRDERLQPILDTLLAASWWSLSLTALSTRLRSSGAQ